jgi:hypothetical protein
MQIVFIVFLVLVGSFLTLRKISLSSDDKLFSMVESFIIGLLTWVFLLSLASWAILALYLVYLLLEERFLGSLLGLIFIGMATGFAIQANEVLDASTVVQFIRRAMFFRPTKPHSLVFQEELDRKRVRDIHRETSDKPFPEGKKQRQLLTDDEIKQYRKEMLAAKDRPARSQTYDEEIQKLKAGQVVGITDAWKIYTFTHMFHDLYGEMFLLEIDPQTHTFQFRVNILDATETTLQDPLSVFQLKQDLYQLLQVLNTDAWLDWYSEFFDHIVVVCFGIEPDAFGHIQTFPFLRIDIVRSQLTQREGLFFNAADLHTICALTFNQGKRLPDELL